jgi:hypothetical protein
MKVATSEPGRDEGFPRLARTALNGRLEFQDVKCPVTSNRALA